MKAIYQIAYILLFVLFLSACTSQSTPNVDVAPVPTITVSPVEMDQAGFHSLSTRTGIEDVDAVLEAVESGDPQQLRDLIRFTPVACTKADGLGGPPKCLDDEAEGTIVDVLPFLGSEGHFLRKTDVSDFSGVSVISLYAVYKVADSAYSEEAYPAGEYAVMFKGGENQADIVMQVRGGIVRMDYLYPPTSLDDAIQRDASELILAP